MTHVRFATGWLALMLALLITSSASGQTILHVQSNGLTISQGATGQSWTLAFRFLKDAINEANANADVDHPYQIWVAAGNYRPDQYSGSVQTEAGTGLQSATFLMARHVRWYGGFAGNEPQTTAGFRSRNSSTNLTTLSGAINGDTAYHIVTAIRVDLTARMDGFTVTGGNAVGAPAPENADQGEGGGGMLIYGDGTNNSTAASPVVLRCIFTGNLAKYGGGVWFRGGELSHPTFYNCRFLFNTATQDGGGFYTNDQITVAPGLGGKPLFANCIFDLNVATNGGGGALYCQTYSIANIINCTITRNVATSASAIYHGSGCAFDEGLNLPTCGGHERV